MIVHRPIDLSPQGLERSAAMLRASMPRASHFTAEVLRWQYVDNPDGRAVGLEAFDGDRIVSHCVMQPLVAQLYGKTVRGAMFLNAATLPDYLGRGIYFGLAAEVIGALPRPDFSFGIAVTNDLSTPGFVRHCGFRVIHPLEVRAGIGAPPRPREGSAPEFRKLWSNDALRWRLSPPHLRYGAVRQRERTRIVSSIIGGAARLELAALDSTELAGVSFASARWSPVTLAVGLDAAVRWGSAAFVSLPMALRPSPLNLIYADLSGEAAGLDARNMRWRALDFDDF